MTILEYIFKNNDRKSKLDKINYSYFSKYLNKDIILELIDIRNIYLNIIDNNIDTLKKDIVKLKEEYKVVRLRKKELLKNKLELIRSIVNSNIDDIDKDININMELKKIINKEKCIKEKIIFKSQLIKEKTDKGYIKKIYQELKQRINYLKDPLVVTDLLYENKNKYSNELKNVIKNEKAKKCYMTYILEMILNDSDNLIRCYELSINLVNNNIDRLDNISVILENKLNDEQLIALNNFVKIINDNKSESNLDDISDERLKNKTIINTMMHFAKNYKNLSKNRDVLFSEYQMIKSMSLDLEQEKNNISNNLYNVGQNVVKEKESSLDDILKIFNKFTSNIDLKIY